MMLAGDIGGTKTLLGLFERGDRRPVPIITRAYTTNDFRSFIEILDAFEADARHPLTVEAVVAGVAGPVVGQRAQLTNIVWDISVPEIRARCSAERVTLINDLEAMAASVPVLESGEVAVLQRGTARDDGNAVVIAAGTGLGEAYLPRVNGRFEPTPSEGGHADFAPRNDREIELVQMLRARFGRAEVEQVLSGPGLVNLFRLTHATSACVAGGAAEPDPSTISQNALEARCPRCVEALDLFVSAYGSEAGNLALRGLATGGVFVGGGIAPKILPALERGPFMEAFRNKPPMMELLSRVPVHVILNAEAALIGAAVVASRL